MNPLPHSLAQLWKARLRAIGPIRPKGPSPRETTPPPEYAGGKALITYSLPESPGRGSLAKNQRTARIDNFAFMKSACQKVQFSLAFCDSSASPTVSVRYLSQILVWVRRISSSGSRQGGSPDMERNRRVRGVALTTQDDILQLERLASSVNLMRLARFGDFAWSTGRAGIEHEEVRASLVGPPQGGFAGRLIKSIRLAVSRPRGLRSGRVWT